MNSHPQPARGFTIIELLVVVSAVALLAATVLVGVLGGRDRTDQAHAEQAVRVAMLAQTQHATRHGHYTERPDDLELPEGPHPTTGVSTHPRQVSVAIAPDGTAAFASGSADTCTFGRLAAPWRDGAQTVWSDPDTACTAQAALADSAHP